MSLIPVDLSKKNRKKKTDYDNNINENESNIATTGALTAVEKH